MGAGSECPLLLLPATPFEKRYRVEVHTRVVRTFPRTVPVFYCDGVVGVGDPISAKPLRSTAIKVMLSWHSSRGCRSVLRARGNCEFKTGNKLTTRFKLLLAKRTGVRSHRRRVNNPTMVVQMASQSERIGYHRRWIPP